VEYQQCKALTVSDTVNQTVMQAARPSMRAKKEPEGSFNILSGAKIENKSLVIAKSGGANNASMVRPKATNEVNRAYALHRRINAGFMSEPSDQFTTSNQAQFAIEKWQVQKRLEGEGTKPKGYFTEYMREAIKKHVKLEATSHQM
jgi:hypothetical protein